MSNNSNKVNHLAIIMDGNGRWAQSRGLERTAGHRAGADNVLTIMQAAKEFGITVCNAGSYSTSAVAQQTFAYILAHYNLIL